MKKKSYPQNAHTVKIPQYILWLMKIETQYVGKYCEYVDNYVYNLFVNEL